MNEEQFDKYLSEITEQEGFAYPAIFLRNYDLLVLGC